LIAHCKKVVIAIVGGLVLLTGIAMLILPGPAFIVIPAGLAILATEFVWAERAMDRCKLWFKNARSKHQAKKKQREQAYSA
jgi:tellurite resistance protein TerC